MEWEEIILEFCLDITVKGFSKITIKNYKSKLSNTSNYFLGKNVMPLSMTKKDINNWILYQQSLNHQASTINVAVSRMKKLYDYMVYEKYLNSNPFENIQRLPEHFKEIYPLNDEEIKSIITVARNHKYKHIAQRNVVILMLMLDCGLRVSEVANLKEKNILTNQVVVENSKNNKDRSVAISPMLKKELIKYNRVKKRKYGNSYVENGDNYLLVSTKSGGLQSKAIWQIMQEIKKQTDIRKKVRFSGHTLRHTYASMQLRNGLDIYTLSLNMGHSSIQMTENYIKTLKSEDFIEKSLKASTLMNLR